VARLASVSVNQQFGAIGIDIAPAQMNISNRRRSMTIQQEHAQMEVDKQLPTFRVNRRQINNEIRLSFPTDQTQNNVERQKQIGAAGIRRRVNDGYALGDLTNPGNRVAQLARHNTMTYGNFRRRELNIDIMPRSGPGIEWDTGHMRLNWSRHSIVIDFEGDYMSEVSVDPPHTVEVYLHTEPYFRIFVEPGEDPDTSGRYVDQRY